MCEVLQLSITKITNDLQDIRKLQRDYSRYLVGTMETWASIIESNPEMTSEIIKDMKDLAARIKKVTGDADDSSL